MLQLLCPRPRLVTWTWTTQWSNRTLWTEIQPSYISIWELNFKSAEEEPRCLEWTGQEENPNPEEQTIEEEAYRETDNETELNPLASSTFLRGELWTELRPPISLIKNLFSQLLQYQQTNLNTTNANTNTNMAAPVPNGAR